jgi:mono/diheme cytochrome c family protein
MKTYKSLIGISIIVAAIILSCKTQFDTTKAQYTAVKSPEAFERGKVLAFSICAGCHYDHSVNKFIGTQIHDVPGIAGKVYSANLTHSKIHGIAPRYSDAEIRYLFKTGITRDGRYLSYMLRPNMAEEDINAIIVYLRSDDPAVSAADTTVGLTHFTLIGKAYMNMHAKPLEYKNGVKLPADNNQAGLGYYLVDNLGCFHCHSKSLTKLNYLSPDQTPGYLAGGMKLKGENGMEIAASNITPDKNTGIGNYTREQFRKALTDGEAPGRKLKPPMPKFNLLKEQEIDAIYAYLQTVPAKDNKVKGD